MDKPAARRVRQSDTYQVVAPPWHAICWRCCGDNYKMKVVRIMKLRNFLVATLALGLGAPAAYANLLVNGSFEQPGTSCFSATTTLPGWNVVSGNIDIDTGTSRCSGISAADGNFFIDLLGSSYPGTIEQSFETTAGSAYMVSFWFGGNPQWQYLPYANDGPIKSMNALIDGDIAATYSIDTAGMSAYDAGWLLYSFEFVASSATTTLGFQSLNTGGVFGSFLDGVTVEQVQVPEPSTLALFGLGLLGLGIARRRA